MNKYPVYADNPWRRGFWIGMLTMGVGSPALQWVLWYSGWLG